MGLERWIDHLQKAGRYSFERTEALRELALSEPSLKKALQRASSRGRVLPLRRNFYVIVPSEGSDVREERRWSTGEEPSLARERIWG